MSKDWWEARDDALLRIEEGEELGGLGETQNTVSTLRQATPPAGSRAQISPHTGKLTIPAASDLRMQMERLHHQQGARRAREQAGEVQPPFTHGLVAVDDELRGPDGEWLVVTGFAPDARVFTLECLESGCTFRRTAVALQDDIYKRRLRVHRYGMPDVPPELEEDPCVAIDENGCF